MKMFHSEDLMVKNPKLMIHCEKNHVQELQEIMKIIKSLGSGIYTLCFPRPITHKTVRTRISTKTRLVITTERAKPTFFKIKIYVQGCSVSFEVDCNTNEKEKARELLKKLKKEKGWI